MYRYSLLIVASLSILLFASTSFAAIEHETVRYERPVRAIRGELTGFGHVVPTLRVLVFDNGQLWLDDSLAPFQKRKRQNLVASVEPNDKGEFKVKHLPKGLYEVEFGNQGSGGYDILSVLIDVDPNGANDRLCVDVSLEGVHSPRSSVRRCTPERKRANNVLETLRVRPLAEVRTAVPYAFLNLKHNWAWFFLAVEQPDGTATPIQVRYAFDKSDQLPPESFWDYSNIFEAKVHRDTGCDYQVETLAYVRNTAEDGKELPRLFVLRFARGVPEGLLKMESSPPCYVLWYRDYRKVRPKNK